ncbi:MAG: hypothetical protein Rubg2KO_18550 [Rubricoccaceae bacterium]
MVGQTIPPPPMPRFLLALVALLIASSLGVQAQPAPAIDMARLLDTRFFTNQGTFMFGVPKNDFLLFPPAGLDPYDVNGAYLVRDVEENVVGGMRWGTLQTTQSAAFMKVGTSGMAEWDAPLADGQSYTLDVAFDRQVIATILFSVTVEEGGDPFDPKTIWTVDGPWRTHAYFEHETERPDYIMNFNAWVAPDDMPSNTISEVSITRDGEEVAFGHTHVDLTYGWGRAEYRLFKAEGRDERFGRHATNAPNWTAQDVTPGTYEIELSNEDGPFRTFTIEGTQGGFVPHPNSDVNADRSVFLTPRRIGGNNLRKALSVYWIANEAEEAAAE